MLRYRCPRCHEITHRDERTHVCPICAGPMSEADLLADAQPKQTGPSLAELLELRDLRQAYSARA